MPDKDKLPWVQTIRRETGLVELICKHGVGHPAPASVHWMELHGREKMGVHGCCGCCSTPEWKLAAATQGYQIANKLLKDALYKCKCAVRTIDGLRAKNRALVKCLEQIEALGLTNTPLLHIKEEVEDANLSS